jgi:hypothetical protein
VDGCRAIIGREILSKWRAGRQFLEIWFIYRTCLRLLAAGNKIVRFRPRSSGKLTLKERSFAPTSSGANEGAFEEMTERREVRWNEVYSKRSFADKGLGTIVGSE